MHLTRAILYIALALFARKSSRKCHTVRTFGLTAVTKAGEEKDAGRTRRRKRRKKGAGVCGKEERDRKRAVREEFETLSAGGKSGGEERPMVTEPRETESAPAYNLKTHSAFKLLTMAAGYKVLCRYHGEREARRDRARGGGVGGGTSAIQKFDLFERRLRTARRRADRGQILDGVCDKKRTEERRNVFRCRHLSAPACVALSFGESARLSLPFALPFVSRRFGRK